MSVQRIVPGDGDHTARCPSRLMPPSTATACVCHPVAGSKYRACRVCGAFPFRAGQPFVLTVRPAGGSDRHPLVSVVCVFVRAFWERSRGPARSTQARPRNRCQERERDPAPLMGGNTPFFPRTNGITRDASRCALASSVSLTHRIDPHQKRAIIGETPVDQHHTPLMTHRSARRVTFFTPAPCVPHPCGPRAPRSCPLPSVCRPAQRENITQASKTAG